MKEAALNKKIAEVDALASELTAKPSFVFVDYLGLNVAEVTALRRELFESGCEMRVIKNNILHRATVQAGHEGLDDVFKGPTAIVFSSDATAAARIVYNFAKDNPKLGVKAGVVDGKVMSLDELAIIATLPGYEGMLSMLLSVLQAPIRNIALAIKAVAEKQ